MHSVELWLFCYIQFCYQECSQSFLCDFRLASLEFLQILGCPSSMASVGSGGVRIGGRILLTEFLISLVLFFWSSYCLLINVTHSSTPLTLTFIDLSSLFTSRSSSVSLVSIMSSLVSLVDNLCHYSQCILCILYRVAVVGAAVDLLLITHSLRMDSADPAVQKG